MLTDRATLALAIVIWGTLALTIVAYVWMRHREAQDLHL